MTQLAENDSTAEGQTDGATETDETQADARAQEQGEPGEGALAAEEFVEVQIEGEAPPPQDDEKHAPEWVRELRRANREKDRELRELKQKLQGSAQAAAPALGPKPTLESCGYDEEKFEADLDAWKERKRSAEAKEADERKAAEAAQAEWQADVSAYVSSKKDLRVVDFDDAEAAAVDSLSQAQQTILVTGAKNPAALVYAIGKNPEMAKKLASIKNPIKFAWAAADLEKKLTITPRKAAPLPETTVRGSASVSGALDSTLARLEAEADKTGDRTKVIAYKRQQRAKAA